MLGIQKVKLEAAYTKINRINSEMVILNEIIKMINESLDLGELCKTITTSIVEGINIDVCAIVINNDVINNQNEIITIKTKYSASL